MEQWQINLKDLVGSLGFHPYTKWNNTLIKWCKEWSSLLQENDNIETYCSSYPNQNQATEIKVKLGSWVDFKASAFFEPNDNGSFSLSIHFTKSFNFKQDINNSTYGTTIDCYSWVCDSLTEVEIREKNLVMQLLNNGLEMFIIWRKEHGN